VPEPAQPMDGAEPLEGARSGRAPAPDDARLGFVYQEALRGLTLQQTQVESLRISAGTLIFAASFASSLLGSRALSDGLGAWDWAAVVLLLLIGMLAVVMLWPYYNFWSRFDVEELLRDYVDAPAPATMTEMHRALALRLKTYQLRNQRILRRIREAFQLALILLLVEIVAWLFSIAGMSTGS
jgi:hypothetical protein